MKREARTSQSFVSSVISGRSISLTVFLLLFQAAEVLMFWNSGFSDPLFNTRLDFPVGDYPRSIAIGDLDGDGALDLAVANRNSDNISVLPGNGDGTFQTAVNYAVGGGPYSVAIGDLDGDGALDLAVANAYSDDVSVLLGNGNGTFQAAVNYAVGDVAYSVAIGDLDGDGALDLVVVNYLDDNVSVLIGNGDGTFQTAVNYDVGNEPCSVAVGDLDGDGALDLAVDWSVSVIGADDYVAVLLGNGDGTFQVAGNYGVRNDPRSVAVGDLDGDGALDLAVTNFWDDNVSVLPGNGDGTFQTAVNYAVGDGPEEVTVGDLDGDGALDLAVANRASDNVSVLPGNGDGTFQTAVNYAVGDGPYSVAIGDLDGDGALDLAVGNSLHDDVSVLLQASFCVDLDGDEYGSQNPELCLRGELDCDDTNPAVNPGATEVCDNGIDDDCNDLTDYEDPACPCLDNDGDEYGNPANTNCTYPELDCDDGDPDVNPGASEGPPGDSTCSDTADNDCDGFTDMDDIGCMGSDEFLVPDDPGCNTIQNCINQSTGFDVITVRPGTYSENIDFLGKPITVRSQDGAAVTIITSASDYDPVVKFVSGEDALSVLEGFTIKNGSNYGIRCENSSPTIRNNFIKNIGVGFFGGWSHYGIYCEMASPTIVGNVISDVYAISLFSPDPIDIPTAFGIHIDRLRAGTSQLLIANNTIKNIYSSSPSTAISRGIYVDGYATEEVIISDNHISGVVASGGEGAVEGILVLTWSSTHITISNNTISSNAALNTTGYPWGGFLGIGAGAEEGPLTVQNNLIVNNQSSEGSYITTMGMMLGSESTDPSVIAFNTVANNVGGEGEPEPGMYSAGIMVGLADSSSIVKNNIIATNSGYGLSTYGPIQPDYNNVWGNSLGDYDPVGPAPGPHDISEDPVFVNPGFGNYHLRSTSPCIDRGTDVGIADDIDGDVRPQGEGFDMGADEVLPGGGGGWEAASVIGIEDNQASKAVNHLLFLFAPISVSLLWKRKRRTK